MRGLLALGFGVLVLMGCRPADDALATHRLLVMATWIDLSLPQDALQHEPELIASIEAELRRFEHDYYAWGDGELAALNRALTETGRFEASEGLAALLLTSQDIANTTDGAFDPGVGALVELWGFHTGEPPSVPPDDDAIVMTLETFGSIASLVIDVNRIDGLTPIEVSPTGGRHLARPFRLDLGGIAKGAAVDRIVELLAEFGVAPALINAGGDLRVVGTPTNRNWRIGIQAPRSDAVLGTIELKPGEAAFTSGDYERYFEFDGQRLHHILDPRSGRPVTHTQAVSIITVDGTTADAAATALFVAGPDEWRAVAHALGIESVLRVDATGVIEMTAPMRDRFQLSAGVSSDIIVAAD